MDRLALIAANLLVGNPEGAAGLEAVFMGPDLEFTEDATVAVTGAHLPPLLNGVEQPCWGLPLMSGRVTGWDSTF